MDISQVPVPILVFVLVLALALIGFYLQRNNMSGGIWLLAVLAGGIIVAGLYLSGAIR